MIKFLTKSILSYILVLVLIDAPAPFITPFLANQAFASQASDQLDNLLNVYQGLMSREDAINKLGDSTTKNAMNEVQSFISKPENRSVLNSENGKELLKIHNKLTKFDQLKDKLNGDCIDEKYNEYGADLPGRILASAMMVDAAKTSCQANLFTAGSIDELLENVENITEHQTLNGLQEQLSLQGIENAARTYVNLLYTYDPSFGGDSAELSESVYKDQIQEKLCPTRSVSKRSGTTIIPCAPAIAEAIAKGAKNEYKKLKGSEAQRFTQGQAFDEVNNRIDALNEELGEVSLDFEEDGGYFAFDAVENDTDEARTRFNGYAERFREVATSGPGLLLWTDSVREEMGSMRSLEDTTKEAGRWTIEKHDRVSSSDVLKGIEEAKEAALNQVKHLTEKESERKTDYGSMMGRIRSQAAHDASTARRKPRVNGMQASTFTENRKESLIDLVAENPSAAGQMLMEHPEYAAEICEIIGQVAKKSHDDNSWYSTKNMLIWGGLIVGGALLLATGVGALAAFGVWTTAAGTAAASVAGVKALSVAGLAFGVVEGGLWSREAMAYSAEKERLLNSYLTGSGDDRTASEMLEALSEFEDARLNAALAVGFSLFDVGTLVHLGRAGRLAGTTSEVSDLRAATKVTEFVSENRDMARLLAQLSNELGPNAKRIIETVLFRVANQDNADDILRYMAGLDVSTAKKVFEGAFEVCSDLCN